MKLAATSLAVLLFALVVGWAIGLVDFTFNNVVPNQPLQHPQQVRTIDGTNIILDSGLTVALMPWFSTEQTPEQLSVEFSNQLSRAGFEVDVEPKQGNRAELYVRWPRKFRDSAPPFTIPIIRQTVGRYYRKPLAFGMFVGTNSNQHAAASIATRN